MNWTGEKKKEEKGFVWIDGIGGKGKEGKCFPLFGLLKAGGKERKGKKDEGKKCGPFPRFHPKLRGKGGKKIVESIFSYSV